MTQSHICPECGGIMNSSQVCTTCGADWFEGGDYDESLLADVPVSAPANGGTETNTHKVHELKTWEEYFFFVLTGNKTFEVRKNDRDFKVGDVLHLCEYDSDNHRYTGKTIFKKVDYILYGPAFGIFGIEDGYCVMSIKDLPPELDTP